MRNLNVVLTAVAAVTLSASPLSAQWGDIFGRSSDRNVPRGMCRVWIDGVPAHQQPRATDCRTAERERPYYEQRYRRRARVIYGERTNGRYDTRGGVVYGDRDGNCRYVERVIAGRVMRQRVCDGNGVYDRNDRVYDRNGNVIYRGRDGVYRDSRGRVIHRDGRGVWRDRNGRVYDRRGRVYDRNRRRNDRDSDSDSDSN